MKRETEQEKKRILMSICVATVGSTMHAQTVTPLISKDIPEFPGK